jgi:hypothetical protein
VPSGAARFSMPERTAIVIYGWWAMFFWGVLLVAGVECGARCLAACWDLLFPVSDQAWAMWHGRWE